MKPVEVMKEKVDRVNERLNYLESRLDKELDVFNKRISKQGLELDGMKNEVQALASEIKVINMQLQQIDGNTKETKEDVKSLVASLEDLKDKRMNDHYVKPKDRIMGFIWQVVGLFITISIGWLIIQMFPIFK